MLYHMLVEFEESSYGQNYIKFLAFWKKKSKNKTTKQKTNKQ